jgi:hypothetical protein
MGKGRFLNQKLGKRMSRRNALLKTQLAAHPAGKGQRLPKKGVSRGNKTMG